MNDYPKEAASAPAGDGVEEAIADAKEFVEAADEQGFDAADALDLIREFAALDRPRAAVGERTAILAAVLRYDHDRANIIGVGSGSFHKVRNDFVDAILALQSPPAKVER